MLPRISTRLLLFLLATVALGQTHQEIAPVIAKGHKLAESGRFEEARQVYEESLHDFPDSADLRYELGIIYLHEADWPKAIENYQRSVAIEPNQVKAHFYLAEAYFMSADVDRACEALKSAITIAPNDAQVRQKYGEYLSSRLQTRSEGLLQLQKARQLNPNLPRIDFAIGKAQFELTDFPSAVTSFESALKNAEDGEAAFFLAEASAKLGRWETARRNYEYALAHHHADAASFYGLGRSMVELGDYLSAVMPLSRSLALKPSLIEAHFQLGRAYRHLGRNDEANHETKLYAAMNGRVDTSTELHDSATEKAWKYVKQLLGEGKERQALDYLTKFHADDSTGPQNPNYLLGEMYFSMGRIDDAKRTLITARQQSAEDARTAAYLGIVQLASGEPEAGEQSLHSALTLDADNSLALIGMGGIRYRQERWLEAIEYFEKSRTADPGTLVLLCDAYFRVGRKEDALLTAEVIRAFGADQQALLQSVDQLLKRYQAESHSLQ